MDRALWRGVRTDSPAPQSPQRGIRGIRHAGLEDQGRHRDGRRRQSRVVKDSEGNIMALIQSD